MRPPFRRGENYNSAGDRGTPGFSEEGDDNYDTGRACCPTDGEGPGLTLHSAQVTPLTHHTANM